jgi:hypothetical protein
MGFHNPPLHLQGRGTARSAVEGLREARFSQPARDSPTDK